jgi:hypothetical protein
VSLSRAEVEARPLLTVAETADWLGVPQRSLRDQLAPGGDLEHLSVRVGRRIYVRSAPLLSWAGLLSPNGETGRPTSARLADRPPAKREGRK